MTTRQSEPPKPRGNLRVVPPPPGAKATPGPTPADTPRRPTKGEGARAEVARLLSEGLTVSEVARRTGLSRQTVSEWKNHTAAAQVQAEKEARAVEFRDAVAEARAKLKAAAAQAADVLVSQLSNADPAVASQAARTLLDRVGVPRAEVVHNEAPPLDLSGMTDEELEEFERLLAKTKGAKGT